MENLTSEFNNSLIIDSTDLIIDYAELGIDSILDSDILKNIPVVKTIIGAGKIIYDIRERNSMKNIMVFLSELNSGRIDKEKLKKHQDALKNNKRESEKELGRILIILNRLIDNEKIIILAKLYKSYINQEINWEKFVELTEITNRLFIVDIGILKKIYSGKFDDIMDRDKLYVRERLNSLGLVGISKKIFSTVNDNEKQGSYITLTKIGGIYTNIIFRKE